MAARWMSHRAAIAMLIALAPLASTHSFPYVPTQILMPSGCVEPSTPCDGRDVAYVFSQSDDGSVSFRQLNFSSTIDLNMSLERLTNSLPFLKDKPDTTAFGATRTGNGTLLVYAGDCDGGTGDVWSYKQEENWKQREMADTGNDPRGPYFLGGTMAFSSTLAPTMDQPTIYTFGGMCSTPNDNPDEWQSEANYTKSMLSLKPSTQDLDTGYTLGVGSISEPRTPLAGFTFTALTPSMTNKSGIVTQQASWVLLGGHTDQAFINMSTAAVWSLPAETWGYVRIQAPDAAETTDLGVDNVYSRSGHTAVLSEDGKSVVVLGGWVGDVDTPAEPQLAVLEMSEAYSSWQWKIPQDQPTGNGVYGHGAAMLPGNVMIVYGGWEITGSASEKKRQASGTSLPRFFNLTSMSWAPSYTNPNFEKVPEAEPTAPDAAGRPSAKKLGLGLGLGFGLAVVVVGIIILFYWHRKQKKRRNSRDQAVRALSQDASQFLPDHDEVLEHEEGWGPDGWYTGGGDAYQNGERSLGYESLRRSRSNLSGSLPGLHIPRKPLTRQQRGGYVPTAQRPGSFVAVPGRIHPIYEDEEEESYHQKSVNPGEAQTPTSDAPSDPFRTPTATHPPTTFAAPESRASATPSPDGPRHDPEVQDWVSDVDAADALLARMNTRGGQGRVSPTRRNSIRAAALRDDESRSGSNLSESARSATESLKTKRSNPLVPLALFSGSRDVEHQKPGSSSSSSYNTARSSFGALQAEGPSLLMGRGNHDDEEYLPPSPSKSKPRRGWLGSLRRVFSNSENTTPASSREDITHQHDQLGGDYEPGLVGLRGELLRRKQGRQDWEESGGGVAAGEISDWDIERAVEQRLVQVMFTVPRERLRVVNADDEEGERDDEIEELVKPQTAVLVDPDKESQQSAVEQESLREKDITEERGLLQDGPYDEERDIQQILDEVSDLDDDEQEEFDEKEIQEILREVEEDEKFEIKTDRDPFRDEQDDDVFTDKPSLDDDVFTEKPSRDEQPLSPPQDHPEEPVIQENPPHPALRPFHIPPPPSQSRSASHETDLHPVETQPNEPRLSHDDTADTSGLSGVVLEAQAMPLKRERPRTRVSAMVDSWESLSREGSPTRPSPRESPKMR